MSVLHLSLSGHKYIFANPLSQVPIRSMQRVLVTLQCEETPRTSILIKCIFCDLALWMTSFRDVRSRRSV